LRSPNHKEFDSYLVIQLPHRSICIYWGEDNTEKGFLFSGELTKVWTLLRHLTFIYYAHLILSPKKPVLLTAMSSLLQTTGFILCNSMLISNKMEGSASTTSEEHSVSLCPAGAFCAISPVFFLLAVRI
jgi:hypothetical protein